MPDVPLNVYAVEGSGFSVLIDTGIAPMKNEILGLCEAAGNIRYVLITHAHADHIGCNQAVRDKTGAKFLAGGALPWIENYETHIREFCLPEATGEYTPGQAEDVRSIMDEPVTVDITIQDGDLIRPGDETEIQTISLPDHKLEEIAFLENTTRTLFMGDLFLALKAPFFHGFQTSTGFRSSLAKIQLMIEVGQIESVYPAHFAPMNADEALKAVKNTSGFLDAVENHTLEAAKGGTMPEIWQEVCRKMNKELEFRGYAMIEVQLMELLQSGQIRFEGGKWWQN